MKGEINIARLENSLTEIVDIFQNLETTDEITEDNPAFNIICELTDDLCQIMFDMSEVLAEAGSEKAGQIYQMMCSCMTPYGSSSGSTQGSI